MNKSKYITIRYLSLIGKLQLIKSDPISIIITGSVGKTTVKNIIVGVLKQGNENIVYSKKSFNSDLGVPYTILGIEDGGKLKQATQIIYRPILKVLFDWKKVSYLVIEKGVQEPGDMALLRHIVRPDYTVLTSLKTTHTEYFNSEEDYFKEKLQILQAGKESTINYINLDLVTADTNNLKTRGSIVKVSSISKNADITYKVNGKNLYIFGKRLLINEINLLPKYQHANFAIAAAVLTNLGIPIKQIEAGFNKYQKEPGRFSFFDGIKNTKIIDSTYNASVTAVKAALSTLRLSKNTRVFCFGDMRELGKYSEREHKSLIPEINRSCDELYLVGELTKKYYLNNKNIKVKKVKHFKNSKILGEYLKENISKGATILFKGSQNTIYLEEAIVPLLKNVNDTSRLCRQDKYYKKVKNDFFNAI